MKNLIKLLFTFRFWNKITTYLIAAVLPLFFMGSTFTFSPFSCMENTDAKEPGADFLKKDTIEKEFKINRGKKLEIDLKTGGSLDITGWDKEAVYVKARRGGSEESEVNFEETSSGLTITSNYITDEDRPNSGVDLEIKVPDEFDLEMETMGGDITLDKIKGNFNGQTMGGSLDFSNLKGKLNITTMGGDIYLVHSEVDGKVHTMGGQVRIEDVTGDIKGTSMGGNVSLKNVTRKNGESTKDEVVISSMGGNIDVDTAPAGADVNTMGGDINIFSAGKFVNAKTMGGDITISSVDGAVKATTMGGDVEVKVVGADNDNKDISLTSMGGDIYLTVPADFSMDIDISLAFTKNREGDYKIESDFDLKQEITKEWEKRNGSARKYILGTGKTGNAKNKVKIETINGNVILKRG